MNLVQQHKEYELPNTKSYALFIGVCLFNATCIFLMLA